jgi:hypothetical protein
MGSVPTPLVVSVSPTSVYVPTAQRQTFTAAVKNDNSGRGVTRRGRPSHSSSRQSNFLLISNRVLRFGAVGS